MITGNKVRLREKRFSDARDDYTWQTDPELAHLDATSVLHSTFAEYLLDYAYQLRHPSETTYHFSVETLDGRHIGNCTYYNVDRDKGQTELGIMIGDRDYWGKGYGSEAVNLLLDYVFQKTDLQRVYLKTLDWNARAQCAFQKSRFTPCGYLNRDGYSFVLMDMTRPQWQALRTRTESEEDKLRSDRVAG